MLSDADIDRLAAAIAAKQEHQNCPLGLTSDAVAMVNAMAKAWETGKKTAIKTAAGIMVTAAIGALALGIKQYLK